MNFLCSLCVTLVIRSRLFFLSLIVDKSLYLSLSNIAVSLNEQQRVKIFVLVLFSLSVTLFLFHFSFPVRFSLRYETIFFLFFH